MGPRRARRSGTGLGADHVVAWQSAPTLEGFEGWILEQKGGTLDPVRVRRVNSLILGEAYDPATVTRLAAIERRPLSSARPA